MTYEYESSVVRLLRTKLVDPYIENEIRRDRTVSLDQHNNPLISKQKSMRIEDGLYSPRIDVAIGPFSFAPGGLNELYETLLEIGKIKRFILDLSRRGKYILKGTEDFLSYSCLSQNTNPRCFFAIEIEDKTSRKHFMGSVLNSSIMGKIGLVVCYDDSEDKMNRNLEYLKEMMRREKIPRIMRNVIWIKKSDFDEILSQL